MDAAAPLGQKAPTAQTQLESIDHAHWRDVRNGNHANNLRSIPLAPRPTEAGADRTVRPDDGTRTTVRGSDAAASSRRSKRAMIFIQRFLHRYEDWKIGYVAGVVTVVLLLQVALLAKELWR